MTGYVIGPTIVTEEPRVPALRLYWSEMTPEEIKADVELMRSYITAFFERFGTQAYELHPYQAAALEAMLRGERSSIIITIPSDWSGRKRPYLPIDKPSHKMTTLERMRQGQVARREMLKRSRR